MHKIDFHSIVDVITNSSTTIYTNSEGSVGPARELIEEILKVFGIDKEIDDILVIETFLDYNDMYLEYDFSGNDMEDPFAHFDGDYNAQDAFCKEIISDILAGNIKKPEWMEHVEEYSRDDNDISLFIGARYEKYEPLCEKIVKFLYSPDSFSAYN